MSSNLPQSKVCSKCQVDKPLGEFHRDKHVSDGHCYECKGCAIARSCEYQRKNPEKVNAKNRKWRHDNPDSVKQSSAKWKRDNREAIRIWSQLYLQDNLARFAYRTSLARASKIMRTPVWANEICISMIYRRAAIKRKMGQDVHVDHIIPLQGELVSGLHVPENLQILEASENLSKSNSFEVAA